MKKDLKNKLKQLSQKKRYQKTFRLFSAAPGVGWFTAIRLVLEWGADLTRFSSGKKFASFTGLTASEHSTGATTRRGRITGQSNPEARSRLIECAWTAYKRDPALLHKFQAVYQATGGTKKAIVAVAPFFSPDGRHPAIAMILNASSTPPTGRDGPLSG